MNPELQLQSHEVPLKVPFTQKDAVLVQLVQNLPAQGDGQVHVSQLVRFIVPPLVQLFQLQVAQSSPVKPRPVGQSHLQVALLNTPFTQNELSLVHIWQFAPAHGELQLHPLQVELAVPLLLHPHLLVKQ